jgi:hypothetical protein
MEDFVTPLNKDLFPSNPALEMDFCDFTLYWKCYYKNTYKNNSYRKFFNHECYNSMGLVGKKVRFLEIKKSHHHNFRISCTFLNIIFKNKFKFNPI